MTVLLAAAFLLGYTLITLEHPLKLDKAATALLTGAVCWIIIALGAAGLATLPAGTEPAVFVEHALFEHLGEIAQILFFLLGAMTIVELIDAHDGFKIITDRIATTKRVRLLWLISWAAFFLSAVLDNLTTAIIFCALLRRLVQRQEERWLFGGFVILAANAGGAWSPIGDVTTIMLWVGGQLSAPVILQHLFLPAVVSLLAPLALASWRWRRGKTPLELAVNEPGLRAGPSPFRQKLMLGLGGGALLFVPVFKYLTHLPPYVGVLFGLGLLWSITEWLYRAEETETRQQFSVAAMLQRIDTPSILFFLGILLAVGALETAGQLHTLAGALDRLFQGNVVAINTLIGLLSAVVDNVPLVAAAMGMYDLNAFPADHVFWQLLAYCAGTGGSILIIGSAAGVAAMGILKMDFGWYLRQVAGYALVGYFAGLGLFLLLQ